MYFNIVVKVNEGKNGSNPFNKKISVWFAQDTLCESLLLGF